MLKVERVFAQEILDSRGNPTVAAQLTVSGHTGYEEYLRVPQSVHGKLFPAIMILNVIWVKAYFAL